VIALVQVEVRRYLARRLNRLFAILALAIVVLAGVLVFVNTAKEPVDDRFLATDLVGTNPGDAGVLASAALGWVIISFVLGASFIGADWRAGTMTTLFTWEPRRVRTFVAKATVVAGLGAALVVVLDLLLLAALWPSAVFHGSTAGVDGDFWREIGGALVQTGAAGALMALLGFTIASLGRNTAAALSVVFAFFVVIENIIRGLRPGWATWLFFDNLAVLLLGGSRQAETDFARSALGAGLVLGLYVGVLLIAAGYWYVRRDVT
jgi:hypothetical protein